MHNYFLFFPETCNYAVCASTVSPFTGVFTLCGRNPLLLSPVPAVAVTVPYLTVCLFANFYV